MQRFFYTIFIFVIMPVFIFLTIVTWKIFTKAGKPGWASIVPIYNKIVLFEIIGYNWYYIFLLFLIAIPFIGPVILMPFTITYNIKFAKSFGQGIAFGIGLCLVEPIFLTIIAFNNNMNYIGTVVNGDIDFNDLF